MVGGAAYPAVGQKLSSDSKHESVAARECQWIRKSWSVQSEKSYSEPLELDSGTYTVTGNSLAFKSRMVGPKLCPANLSAVANTLDGFPIRPAPPLVFKNRALSVCQTLVKPSMGDRVTILMRGKDLAKILLHRSADAGRLDGSGCPRERGQDLRRRFRGPKPLPADEPWLPADPDPGATPYDYYCRLGR